MLAKLKTVVESKFNFLWTHRTQRMSPAYYSKCHQLEANGWLQMVMKYLWSRLYHNKELLSEPE